MTITDDEREAREWLRHAEHYEYNDDEDARHRATILALLDRPVMPRPEDVPDKVLREMCFELRVMDDEGREEMSKAIGVLYNHVTAPQKKPVEVWAVLWPSGTVENIVATREAADRLVSSLTQPGRIVRLVEVSDDQ